MSTKIIKYTKDGWVCDRYPYCLTDYYGEIEVDETIVEKTYATGAHFAWRVVNGELVNERYEETPVKEIRNDRIKELKRLLADSDYKATKYAEGWLTEEEYAPIKAQRQAWRDEINELEQELEQDIPSENIPNINAVSETEDVLTEETEDDLTKESPNTEFEEGN